MRSFFYGAGLSSLSRMFSLVRWRWSMLLSSSFLRGGGSTSWRPPCGGIRSSSKALYEQKLSDIHYNTRQPHRMSLDKFFNMKPRPADRDRMDVENPEREAALPWVEKYRPNKLNEITYQEEVTSSLSSVLKTGNLPHLLFYGPAGTGKTSAIIALSKELFGPKFYKQRVLQLNASDERGINVVREKVKKFAQLMCVKSSDKTYLCPNYKIVILDEADLMTTDAQSALRRVIEDNSTTTRFCIICNYITKIIEPLSSRCVKFRFKPIPLQAQLDKLNFICQSEDVKLDNRQLHTLLEKGDLRQSINSLQSLHRLAKVPEQLLPVGEELGADLINKLSLCTDIKEVYQIGQEIGYEGYACDQLLTSLSRAILQKERDQRKAAIMLEMVSRAEENLLLGASELPITEVITSIYYVMNLQL